MAICIKKGCRNSGSIYITILSLFNLQNSRKETRKWKTHSWYVDWKWLTRSYVFIIHCRRSETYVISSIARKSDIFRLCIIPKTNKKSFQTSAILPPFQFHPNILPSFSTLYLFRYASVETRCVLVKFIIYSWSISEILTLLKLLVNSREVRSPTKDRLWWVSWLYFQRQNITIQSNERKKKIVKWKTQEKSIEKKNHTHKLKLEQTNNYKK